MKNLTEITRNRIKKIKEVASKYFPFYKGKKEKISNSEKRYNQMLEEFYEINEIGSSFMNGF